MEQNTSKQGPDRLQRLGLCHLKRAGYRTGTAARKCADRLNSTSSQRWVLSGNCGWGGRIRTYDTRYQKPMPYHLATPQHARAEAHWQSRLSIHKPAGGCNALTGFFTVQRPSPCGLCAGLIPFTTGGGGTGARKMSHTIQLSQICQELRGKALAFETVGGYKPQHQRYGA